MKGNTIGLQIAYCLQYPMQLFQPRVTILSLKLNKKE